MPFRKRRGFFCEIVAKVRNSLSWIPFRKLKPKGPFLVGILPIISYIYIICQR